jgi:hypothetical protein
MDVQILVRNVQQVMAMYRNQSFKAWLETAHVLDAFKVSLEVHRMILFPEILMLESVV